jgi:hypothetical protein
VKTYASAGGIRADTTALGTEVLKLVTRRAEAKGVLTTSHVFKASDVEVLPGRLALPSAGVGLEVTFARMDLGTKVELVEAVQDGEIVGFDLVPRPVRVQVKCAEHETMCGHVLALARAGATALSDPAKAMALLDLASAYAPARSKEVIELGDPRRAALLTRLDELELDLRAELDAAAALVPLPPGLEDFYRARGLL